jgi:tetratricopeptide (TPR) repeat protein
MVFRTRHAGSASVSEPSSRSQRLRARLAYASEAVEDAHNALRTAPSSRSGDTALEYLRTASEALEAARRLAGPQRVTAPPVARGAREEHDMHRRDFTRLLASLAAAQVGGGQTLETLLDLERNAQRPGRLGADQVRAMRTLTASYADAYTVADPASLTPLVTHHVNAVTGRLDEPMTPGVRRQLASAAAEVASLAGWLAALEGRRGDARGYYYLARDTAREALDDTQQALALGSIALLTSALRRNGSGSQAAARLLEQADLLIPRSAPAAARAWLAGQLAEQEAALGNGDAARRALAVMREAFAGPRDGHPNGTARPYTETAVLTFWGEGGVGPDQVRGVTAAFLGEPEAIPILRRAADRAPEPLGAVTLRIDLGQAQLRQGEVEEACETLGRVVPPILEHGWTSRLEWLRGVRRQIQDTRLPAVRAFDELLAAV